MFYLKFIDKPPPSNFNISCGYLIQTDRRNSEKNKETSSLGSLHSQDNEPFKPEIVQLISLVNQMSL